MQRPFAITGLDLSGYMVKNADRAIAFYRDVLGLEPTRIYPVQPSNGILFAVDDLDAAVAEFKEGAIPIVMEIDLPHCRMAAINDSEGNSVFLHKRKSVGQS